MPYRKKKSTREKTRKLLALAKGGKRCLIFIQNNPDPDAIAGAMALARLLRFKQKVNSIITFDGLVGRAENQAMVKYLKIALAPIDEVRMEDYDLTALVDTQPGTGNNCFPDNVTPDIVIDHHPLREKTKAAPFYDVKTNYGATSTILTEYLYEENVHLTKNLATAIAYGIRTDTQNLGRETSVLDIDAFHYAYNHCNTRLLAKIENEKVPQQYFAEIAKAMKNATIYEDVVITGLGEITNPDMVGEMADLLLRLEHMRGALCYGFLKDQAVVSIRTIDEELDAGAIVREMIKATPVLAERATGGGHGMMAGAQIQCQAKNGEKEKIEKAIRDSFLNVIGASKRARRRLVRKTDRIDKE